MLLLLNFFAVNRLTLLQWFFVGYGKRSFICNASSAFTWHQQKRLFRWSFKSSCRLKMLKAVFHTKHVKMWTPKTLKCMKLSGVFCLMPYSPCYWMCWLWSDCLFVHWKVVKSAWPHTFCRPQTRHSSKIALQTTNLKTTKHTCNTDNILWCLRIFWK